MISIENLYQKLPLRPYPKFFRFLLYKVLFIKKRKRQSTFIWNKSNVSMEMSIDLFVVSLLITIKKIKIIME